MSTMVKMVMRCAKESAPCVIYIGECEKVNLRCHTLCTRNSSPQRPVDIMMSIALGDDDNPVRVPHHAQNYHAKHVLRQSSRNLEPKSSC